MEVRAELQRECAFSSAPHPPPPPKSRMTPACRSLAAAAMWRVGSPSAAASGACRLGTPPCAALARPGSRPAPGTEAASSLGGRRVKGLMGGTRPFGSCRGAGAAGVGHLREPVFPPVSGR